MKENDINTIGQSMKNARKMFGFTQSQLAERVGISRAAISFWENGINIPNVIDCWKIADALNISIDELLGRYLFN